MQSFIDLIPDSSLKLETAVHVHSEEERGDRYLALDSLAVELEVAHYLHALVFLYKPEVLLETGSGVGIATAAICSAMALNGRVTKPGHLSSIERAEHNIENAKNFVPDAFSPFVDFFCQDSMEFIQGYDGKPFDFVLLDTGFDVRHKELQLLLDRELLNKGCVVTLHDTSKERHRSLKAEWLSDHDNRPMLAEVDKICEEYGIKERLEFPFSRGLLTFRI